MSHYTTRGGRAIDNECGVALPRKKIHKFPNNYSMLLFKAVELEFLELNGFSHTDVQLRLNAAYAPHPYVF